MSSTVLEQLRAEQEAIESYERAVVSILNDKPRNVRPQSLHCSFALCCYASAKWRIDGADLDSVANTLDVILFAFITKCSTETACCMDIR